MVKSTVKKYTLHLLRVKSLAQGQLDRDGECCHQKVGEQHSLSENSFDEEALPSTT